MPQARSFKPQPVQPQPFNKVACTQKLHVLGLSLKNKELAQNFADLSCAVELSVFGRTQGRGVHIPVVRQPLQIQGRPGAGWGANSVHFGGVLFCGWSPARRALSNGPLDRSCCSVFLNSGRAPKTGRPTFRSVCKLCSITIRLMQFHLCYMRQDTNFSKTPARGCRKNLNPTLSGWSSPAKAV